MAYLIIPVVCFLLMAGLIWALFGPHSSEKVWKGKIDDLDLTLSVLMTAEWEEPYLILKVPRRVTSLKMTFPGYAVRLEMPLVTQLQQSRKESYLVLLRDLMLEVRQSTDDNGHDVLKWTVDGPPVEASALIKDIFVKLFEVDPGRHLEFRSRAQLMDQYVIEQGLGRENRGEKAELPTAYSQGRQLETFEESRAGCLKMLAVVLLLPIPFVMAHLAFGYLAASTVLMSVIVIREVYRRYKRSKGGSRFGNVLKVGVLLLTGATMVFSDPLYLQLIPTAALVAVAVAELLAVSLNMPHLSAFDPKNLGEGPRTGRVLFSFAVIATCVGGAAINEYLRMNVTLDAWVWFFAFFRTELILGFLVSSIPFFYYMVQHVWRTDGYGESS